jgi:5'-3' exonuclease
MGINNINKFLKDKVPNAFFSLNIDKLRGKKIAIDGAHWAFTNMAIARKIVVNKTNLLTNDLDNNEIRKEWFSLCLNFLLLLLSHNITPIVIFDGENPIEKTDTKSERRETQINYKDKIDNLTLQLKATPTKEIAETLKKSLRNYIHISSENFLLFKTTIASLGIPCIQAKGEGEQLCSSLCIDGLVAAVFSADTDNLVYGCPLLLTNFKGGNVCQFECVRIDTILQELNISHKIFIDLCIMSGCDFNTNMHGYGVAKSFALLKKYISIDLLPSNLDITCLNHFRCREIFSYRCTKDLLLNDYSNDKTLNDNIFNDTIFNDNIFNFNKDVISCENAKEYLSMIGLFSLLNKITLMADKFESSEIGYLTCLNLTNPHITAIKMPLKLKIVSS